MKLKTVLVDFGAGQLPIDVPESATVVEQPKPSALKDPEAAVREALANPIGMPPIREWVKPDSKVTIGFDDPTRPALPRQVAIPVIIEQLLEAGVRLQDITLINAGCVHRKYTPAELRDYLGPKVFDMFEADPSVMRVINHDASDPDQLVRLGLSDTGDYMEYNRCLVDSDYVIFCGTVMPNNWGGANGMGVVNGLASARSCRATHRYPIIGHPRSNHCDPRTSHFNIHKRSMLARIEEATSKQIFFVNAFISEGLGVAAFHAGHAPELNEVEWDFMEKHYQVDCPQADILVAGIPGTLGYSDSHNPLTFLTSIMVIPRWWVGKPLMREGGVLIGLGECIGVYDDPRYRCWAEMMKIWDRVATHTSDLSAYEDDFLNRRDLLDLYHHHYSYHPIHGFWLLYQCQYTYDRLSKIIAAGKVNPEACRRLNITPATDFAQAYKMATAVLDDNPTVVVMPSFWGGIHAQYRVH